MKLGAQSYTIRDFTKTETDFYESMKKIKNIGYEGVQLSAVGPIDPKRIREICDEFQLEIAVTHSDPRRILEDWDALIEEHRIYGCRYIGIGAMPGEYRDSVAGAEKFITDFLPAARRLRDQGMKFMYHNHDFEFLQEDGRRILDVIADGFEPDLLGFIVDTFWVQVGGGDPAYWLKKLRGRIETIHLKDMSYRKGRIMAPVGSGNMYWEPIIDACKSGGCQWILVEQDTCDGDPFEALKISYDYVSKLNYR